MRNSTIDIRPLSGALGAEILGVDLSQSMDDRLFQEVRQCFWDYGVIFFRDQHLTPEQHIAFAERFGPVNVNRFFAHPQGYPMISEIRKEPEQRSNLGGTWHTDHSYDQVPALGSVLLAREVPESGGDTMFASMELAYETLSDGLKRTLEGLRAVHTNKHVFGAAAMEEEKRVELKGRLENADLALQEAVHPVVVRHPDTGRKVLYVNSSFTVRFEGWTADESRPLLEFLYRHAARPEHTCRFRWRDGSLAMWDNRSTWHYAVNDYHGARRLLHRITIEGVPLR